MSRRKRRHDEEETSYWLSYSDMMAALLLIFILIISFTLLQAKGQYENKEQELSEQQDIIKEQEKLLAEQQDELDRIIGIRSDLIEDLHTEFSGSDLNVLIDSQTGAITFDASVLFDVGESEIKDEGLEFLKSFIPRYCGVILQDKYKDYVSEIIIEGHTDTNGTYLYNLELSQQRAFSVATFCLTESSGVLPSSEIETLRSVLTANGRSYSNPVYNDDGTVNLSASRRVEFKFRLKDDEMIDEMVHIMEQ
jgi:chemotaxis protein MotB